MGLGGGRTPSVSDFRPIRNCRFCLGSAHKVSSVLRFGLYWPRMHACNVLKRSVGRPSSWGTGTVRMGCVLGMLGELQLGQKPIHAPTAPREHHETRRGSACRAAPRLVCDSARAANTYPHARAALPSSLSGERIASPCHSTPEQHGERGMANDEQMGRGVAGECGRAHQIGHCHQ